MWLHLIVSGLHTSNTNELGNEPMKVCKCDHLGVTQAQTSFLFPVVSGKNQRTSGSLWNIFKTLQY